MDTTLLEGAGLTRGEAKVYLALLERGPSTSGPIVQESGITKSIIYRILDRLIKKGLVSYIVKEKTKHYQAAHPTKLLEYIDERKESLESQREKINEAIPQLLMKHAAKQSSGTIFEGFSGMVSAYEQIYTRLKAGDECYFMGIPGEQPEHFRAYWVKDHKRREKAKIKVRLLYNTDAARSTLENRNSFGYAEARYMPVTITTPAWILGYKDVTIICIPSTHSITVQIINAEIGNSFKAYFEALWKQSKPFK